MVISRIMPLARTLLSQAGKQSATRTVVPRRNHGDSYGYRQHEGDNTPRVKFLAEAAGALMWWWILWHIFTEYEHITGEYPYPDPSKWTNEELGIPPDNYDPPKKE